MEEPVEGAGDGTSPAVQTVPGRERPAEAVGGRVDAGKSDAAGRQPAYLKQCCLVQLLPTAASPPVLSTPVPEPQALALFGIPFAGNGDRSLLALAAGGDESLKSEARIYQSSAEGPAGRSAAKTTCLPEARSRARCRPERDACHVGASCRFVGTGRRRERHSRPSPVDRSRLDSIPRNAGSPRERRPFW